ncbi:Hypothetical predicted protein [Mytilus galloprovincialis]|uniref:CARD domain-containing protein n=1 Tax=Mytilus galloprovincialis TaxID=29158 RepID=A0A8B6GK31_MYTGA|nr:Hypothetical predicted protein [Mytilus galloprovincialis]
MEEGNVQGRRTHSSSMEDPIPTEEDHRLQAAYTVLYTVPRAIEHYIDREYKGGFLQAIRDHKDQLKTKLRSDEWDLLSQLIVHHRLYHFYDKIKQDAILDKDVLDKLISRCILVIDDRAEIEHYHRQSDRNKCILDLLIQRPQDSYSVLLEVLKESPTCPRDLIECMESKTTHQEVDSHSMVKSSITGNHSVRLQKNYHHLTQNLSDLRNVIDSLISKGVLEPDDHEEIVSSAVSAEMNRKLIAKIRSEQDYLSFLEALKEDPGNEELASDLESTDVSKEELNLVQTATPSLTNRPGFQTLVTLVSMVKDVQIAKTEPERHDTSLSADLYRLQFWYKKIFTMTTMELQEYQQFVETTQAIFMRMCGKDNPDNIEIRLSPVLCKQVKKILDHLKENKEKETEEEEVIPRNIREQIKDQIEDWEQKDKKFVSTRASDYVMESIQKNNCVTLTAPAGVGKTFICRHTALVLQKKGYKIIPVYAPTDIRDYYQPGKQTVFIVDDICGNYTANQQQIDNWKQLLPVINKIVADKCCKIIISCRLQVYMDEKFKILTPFKSCECNLVSDELCLTSDEKTIIAKTYLGKSVLDIDDVSQNSECFPLLCSLYYAQKNLDMKEFFRNPFIVYKNELDKLSEAGDEGNFKICSLALCVLFNNDLKDRWFQGKMTDVQRQIMEDTCEACEINRSTSKAKLKKELDTLDGTFICKQNGIYRTVHDKLFDFLAHYFGQKMIECLIDHADSDLLHERFIWQKSPDDMNRNIDFIIDIPGDYLKSYLQRLIKDWSAGKVSDMFDNTNMKESSFRQQLLQNLQQLDVSQQVTLASTKDTVRPKEDYGSGTTPLIDTCYEGYHDMVEWLLHNDVDVDQCKDNGATGLIMASQEGHTDIVKLLLEKNPDVDLCSNDGWSPLNLASAKGHTDIVKLLLEKDPNVDLCHNDGLSPLNTASHEGHTDIVKLLLEKNPNVDLCHNDGWSPLNTASAQGHTEIVKLLLEKNPDVDLCSNNGLSPLNTASDEGHTDIVKLLLEKNPNVDLCNNDGWSPLNSASDEGHTDIVKLLLEKNPNVDLCNNNGFTPLISSCINNNTSIVKLLIKHKANINAQTYDGGHALYFSALNGNLEITQLLLENNADCNICIHSQQSITDTLNNHPSKTLDEEKQALFVSLVENKSSHVTDYVSKKSVDYAFDVVAGSSPIHIACFMGRMNVVLCLLDHYAYINLTKKDGTTPLFYACEVGHEDIVRLLLDKGADTQILRLDGKSPLQIATDNGHTSIELMLTNLTNKAEPNFS